MLPEETDNVERFVWGLSDSIERNVTSSKPTRLQEGTERAVGLAQWFEKMESVFYISNCVVECQVKYATCTFLGGVLTWWNSHVRTVGHDAAYEMSWKSMMKMMTEAYCPRNEIQNMILGDGSQNSVDYEVNQNSGNKNGNENENGNGNRNDNENGSHDLGSGRTLYTTPYEMSWKSMMKMMTEAYCPRNEIQKLEKKL
uniref:Reverse transcriptase domain-containing protein n=1 Tax=Tanacetum cinerariifolium TaxID=118510 RepID=A0A6L2LTY1_TANCI|nr:hypothetical protein [Tanacetum cinerariifolium]